MLAGSYDRCLNAFASGFWDSLDVEYGERHEVVSYTDGEVGPHRRSIPILA